MPDRVKRLHEDRFAAPPSPYHDVHSERVRAHLKHNERGGSMERKPWDHHAWLPVLTEEVGEVARVLCEDELGNEPDTAARLREELVQVAAMACAWIDAIDDEGDGDG